MQSTRPAWWQTPIYLVSWLLTSILCLVDALLVRNAVLRYLIWDQARTISAQKAQGISPNQFQLASSVEAIDKVVLLIVMCVAIAFVIWIENYIRKGAKQGKMIRRIVIVAGIEVGIAAIALIVQTVLAQFQ